MKRRAVLAGPIVILSGCAAEKPNKVSEFEQPECRSGDANDEDAKPDHLSVSNFDDEPHTVRIEVASEQIEEALNVQLCPNENVVVFAASPQQTYHFSFAVDSPQNRTRATWSRPDGRVGHFLLFSARDTQFETYYLE